MWATTIRYVCNHEERVCVTTNASTLNQQVAVSNAVENYELRHVILHGLAFDVCNHDEL
jgi:hypothetical protein